MTTLRQIEANRRNTLKSTSPTSTGGKQRSPCNAVCHGLKAETVIAVLEDSEKHEAFEACALLYGASLVTVSSAQVDLSDPTKASQNWGVLYADQVFLAATDETGVYKMRLIFA